MSERGLYNDVNKQLEYAGLLFHQSNNLVNESGIFASLFAVEDGNVGYVVRNGRENIAGTRLNDNEWDVVNMPIINIPMDTYYYKGKGDQSAIHGAATADLTCAVKEYYGFELDIAFLTSYNSNPDVVANPIMKVNILGGNANPVAKPVTIVNGNTNPVFTKEVA
jgi:hypothetical protein